MAPPQIHTQSNLPQEIIDLIIDEVASQKPAFKARDALRACCLASKSLSYRARHNLWRDIVFSVDGTLAERANRFVRVLKQMDDKTLVSKVHSLELLFKTPKVPQETKNTPQQMRVVRSIRRLFERQYDIYDVFEALKNPNFRHLSIAPPEGVPFFYWGNSVSFLQPTLLRIISSSELTSFGLCNISSVANELVAAAFFSRSVEDITIRNSLVKISDDAPINVQASGGLADLRRLEMTRVSFQSIMSLILRLLPSSKTPQPLFPHLKTLVVSVPQADDISMLWKYLLGAAVALETLVIDLHHEHHYLRNLYPQLDHLSFSKHVSLRHFTFRTVFPDIIALIEESQCALLNIFTFQDFSIKLKSVELRFLFRAMWDHTAGASFERLKQAKHWDTLDQLFIGERFINLESLKISVEVRHFPNRQHKTQRIPAAELYDFAKSKLPLVSGVPHIELTLDGRLVFCDNPTI